MFEKFMRAAERAAAGASRRQFLGRLGQVALGVAGALGASLVMPGEATAGRHDGCPKGYKRSTCGDGSSVCCRTNEKCRLVRGVGYACAR